MSAENGLHIIAPDGTECRHTAAFIVEAVNQHDALLAENAVLRLVLGQIVCDLPTKRDWLDPELEANARTLLALTTPTERR
jgi:hypothetical protein